MFSGLERERERGNTDHSRCNKPQPVENYNGGLSGMS